MRLIDADALHEKANGLNWKERSVIQHALRVSPTIEAEPVRHATWKLVEHQSTPLDTDQALVCTHCGFAHQHDAWFNICPNCGAKMDLKEG